MKTIKTNIKIQGQFRGVKIQWGDRSTAITILPNGTLDGSISLSGFTLDELKRLGKSLSELEISA